ncbi:MAG: hypothetical protein ACFFD2_19190 [Promethearchaeota archaeon]
MKNNQLSKWLQDQAIRLNCNLIGFAELNSTTKKEICYSDYYIDDTPARYIIVLAMVLEDPIQDCWTQSPLWKKGKNFIDEVLARVGTLLALKLTKIGYICRMLRYDNVFLKNLAVHAGLGIIGRNNLLITPQYGPHLRLRALLTNAPLTPSLNLIGKFNPCSRCPEMPPCIKVCPSGAFKPAHQAGRNAPNHKQSPRSGYTKVLCRNYSRANLREIGPYTYLWCRACEEACPVGNETMYHSNK